MLPSTVCCFINDHVGLELDTHTRLTIKYRTFFLKYLSDGFHKTSLRLLKKSTGCTDYAGKELLKLK